MRCPSCGTEVADPLAAFCPRCAAPLGDESGEATTRLDAPVETSDTSTIETVEAEDSVGEDPTPEADALEQEPVEHLAAPAIQRVGEVRDRLDRSGWLDAAAAAGLGFLVLLAVGALLVLAAKLNFPQLGGGTDLLGVFNAMVMAGLGSLGVPIVIDGVAVGALPLGAALAIGIGLMWAVRSSLKEHSFPTVLAAVIQGVRVGTVFGVLCWLFALIFRVRGVHPVASDAGIALLAGFFWGSVFGALGAVRLMETLREALRRISSGVRAREPSWYEGAATGFVMLSAAAVMAAAVTLLWIIVALAKGAPGKYFSAGDAFAYVVYIAAFFPNILVAIISLSVGAPIDVGAKVDLGGKLFGPLREYSLAAWGNGDAPAYLWLLVLIPLFACALGGLYARRRTNDTKTMLPVLLIGSGVFAVVVTLVGAMGPVRLAGVLRGSGYAFLAPDAVLVFCFAFLISGVLGFAGWKLGETTPVLETRFRQVQ